jgi:hypothetical protein
MPNVTLAIDEDLLARGREYAKQRDMSLNALVRELLDRTTRHNENWLEDMFALADQHPIDSGGVTWNREELYNRGR